MKSILIRWRFWQWLIERDHSDEACAFFWAILSDDGDTMLTLQRTSTTLRTNIYPVVKRIRKMY